MESYGLLFGKVLDEQQRKCHGKLIRVSVPGIMTAACLITKGLKAPNKILWQNTSKMYSSLG